MPGSARWGRVELGDDAEHGAAAAAKTPTRFREKDAVTIAARPGDTLFFGPYTAHASFENKSDRYRRILINGYASPGANRRIYPGEGAGRRLTAPTARV
jgi:ectoine hydroxylase-related dioxygenase (phytanoyl-CoA dioxygenase family)